MACDVKGRLQQDDLWLQSKKEIWAAEGLCPNAVTGSGLCSNAVTDLCPTAVKGLCSNAVTGICTRKKEKLTQCLVNVGPPSATLAQQEPSIRWMYLVFWDAQYLANTRRWANFVLMLGHRLRRWPIINPTLAQCLVFAERLIDVTTPWSIRQRSEPPSDHHENQYATSCLSPEVPVAFWRDGREICFLTGRKEVVTPGG